MLNYQLDYIPQDNQDDYNDSSQDVAHQNPFLGLRSFSTSDSYLFFGREENVDSILSKLIANKFVGVIGYSGSGKSSLISCGVLPAVYGGFAKNLSSKWKIIKTKPEVNPIGNLSQSIQLSDAINKPANQNNEEKIIRKIITSLLMGMSGGIDDVFKKFGVKKNQNILIFIDQFEDLFKYAKLGIDEEEQVRLYIRLILEVCNSSIYSVYVVMTMQADYLGECSKYKGLSDLVNKSNYLVPQMTREQKKKAILGPISVCGGKITDKLLKKVLNDLGDKQDQLPILQHTMMRTWEHWIRNRQNGEPIDVVHYNAVGKISEALSLHADEVYDSLNTNQKEVAEVIFKSLCSKTKRKSVRIHDVSLIAEVTYDRVIDVVEKFRMPECSFLIPTNTENLTPNTVIDISHESLTRIWIRLKNWIEEEYESSRMYRRISEASAMYQIGKTGLWKPPDLQLAIDWQRKQKPTLAWARKYDEAFERSMVFLETSIITYEAELHNKEKLQKRLLQRTRGVAVFLGIATIVSILFFVYAFTQRNEAIKQAQLAEAGKLEAEKQRNIANEEKIKANEQRVLAQERLVEAEYQKKKAEEALLEAENQRRIAENNAEIARKQTGIANRQSAISKKATQIAEIERKKAQKNFNDAQKLFYQITAQAMSVKLLSIENPNLKALLANQAKQFFNKYEGRKYDTYLYSGLYNAYAEFMGNKYNVINQVFRDAVRSISLDSKDRIYATGTDGSLKLVSYEDNQINDLLLKNNFPNKKVVLSPDENWIVVSSDSSHMDVVNLKTKEIQMMDDHSEFVSSIVFVGKTNNFYSSSNDKTIRLNNLDSISSEEFANLDYELKSLDLDLTEKYLVAATNEGKILLINTKTKSIDEIYDNGNIPIQSVKFSPDGKLLVFGNEKGTVFIMNFNERKVLYKLSNHKGRVSTIAFSNDAKLMATAGFDGIIFLWNVDEFDELPIKIVDGLNYVWDIKFSNQGDFLLSANDSGEIKYWPTDASYFYEKLCDNINKNMTIEEWNIYVGEEIEYRNTCLNLMVRDY